LVLTGENNLINQLILAGFYRFERSVFVFDFFMPSELSPLSLMPACLIQSILLLTIVFGSNKHVESIIVFRLVYL
jgi:hypothetical protein